MNTQQLIVLALVALTVFWMVGAYNRLLRLRNELVRQFLPVQAQMAERHALLLQWTEALRPVLDPASPPLQAVVAASQQAQAGCAPVGAQPGSARAVAALRLAEETLAGARIRLQLELPSHVDRMLPTGYAMDAGLAPISEALSAADSTLAFARQQFNHAIDTYNQARGQFPTWIVAGLLRFRAASML
jgi:LemA protein